MRTASFSPDGTMVVTAGGNGVRAWDVKTGKEQGRFGHDFADMASFSADGRFLVTASNREARVWDAGTGSEMLREPIVHANLMVASFSPDGSLVITASGHPDRNGYCLTARGQHRAFLGCPHGGEPVRQTFEARLRSDDGRVRPRQQVRRGQLRRKRGRRSLQDTSPGCDGPPVGRGDA